MNGHDIVVIGASADGVAALSALAEQLPADLPAALFIVQHIAPDSPGLLADLLDRRSALPVKMAAEGDKIARGMIYVAPPDQHLLINHKAVRLSRGARENRTRPSIDVLFRSAAVAYRSRVIGLVLTGYLSDGSAGLLAVKRCGGLTMVQDPNDAPQPDMPRSALSTVDVDYVLPISEIGPALARLTHEPPPSPPPVPKDVLVELNIAEGAQASAEALGALSPSFACPDCGGPLWELTNAGLQRYRCRIGHAFTADALLLANSSEIEQSLWAALRMMEERVNVLGLMAHKEHQSERKHTAKRFEERAAEAKKHAKQLRRLLLSGF